MLTLLPIQPSRILAIPPDVLANRVYDCISETWKLLLCRLGWNPCKPEVGLFFEFFLRIYASTGTCVRVKMMNIKCQDWNPVVNLVLCWPRLKVVQIRFHPHHDVERISSDAVLVEEEVATSLYGASLPVEEEVLYILMNFSRIVFILVGAELGGGGVDSAVCPKLHVAQNFPYFEIFRLWAPRSKKLKESPPSPFLVSHTHRCEYTS
ncbi:hypothetical protein L1887_08518 [Cichorium endivia]|nr:hypothetical protein L1887_08518 [Cichorium endivia]